ncbi:MAG: hypothetical protein M1828_006307 [Chrysothrix sp. TS-e1954]|nr:MAG: hypothetical protein M1828_006307 [Chrysothrix sp. TS-e1954]
MTSRIPTERTHLTPEDAYFVHSPPLSTFNGSEALDKPDIFQGNVPRKTRDLSRDQRRNKSRSRRQNAKFQKILWVKHKNYPDNYTDETTFLDQLKRNPHVRPYEFWPLVADSTVIVQQVCTMIVFVCCFSGIIQERVSPITVVTSGTILTVLGWVLWDMWLGQEEALKASRETQGDATSDPDSPSFPTAHNNVQAKDYVGLGLHIPSNGHASSSSSFYGSSNRSSSKQRSGTSTSNSSNGHLSRLVTIPEPFHNYSDTNPYQHRHHISQKSSSSLPAVPDSPTSPLPPSYYQSKYTSRTRQRLSTLKSALLIYCFLLGLSPILKSLTKSTASDSIWAISFWLCLLNIFFFDYSAGVGPALPASLSTNAVLMASTVLASRLPSTTHVFSLTLFSIEVFGLFPVFRRYLRHVSLKGHFALTGLLVMAAGGGTAVVLSSGGWKAGVVGVIGGCTMIGLAMGGCSWWYIGLQSFKMEIRGPWDVAHPVLRRRWD